MDDAQFKILLTYLGLSWQGYRKVRKGVKKRISRHLQELGCRNVSEYLLALKDPVVRGTCDELMTVSISRFFRDPRLWEVLASEILPELLAANNDRLMIWSAGCACGEEVYTLKMLWDSLGSTCNLPKLHITATDINPICLERAHIADYPPSSLRQTPARFLPRYFQEDPASGRFTVKAFLKSDIEWRLHKLGDDPPGLYFHIIFLRNNLLTYYQDPFRSAVFKQIMDCLVKDGLLIMGCHEKLPLEMKDLLPHPLLPYVFKKRA